MAEGLHVFSASSKESIHVNLLALALNGSYFAQIFISPEDPSQYEDKAIGMRKRGEERDKEMAELNLCVQVFYHKIRIGEEREWGKTPERYPRIKLNISRDINQQNHKLRRI